MITERFWILLGKKKAGEATAAELDELNDSLVSNGLSGYAQEVIDKIWDARLTVSPDQSPDPGNWDEVLDRIAARRRGWHGLPQRPLRWLAAASVAAAFAWFGWLGWKAHAGAAPGPRNEYATQSGSRSKLVLPDGTQVWLNSNSRISYASEAFGRKLREISLSGEAFFDVTHDENAPFVIHAGPVNITVKGTAFNVKAYAGDSNVETSLVRGLIEITTVRDPDRRIVVKPDEKIIIPSGSAPAPTLPVYAIASLHHDKRNLIPETAWMQPRLAFDDESLADLAPKLEAWFNVHITIADESLGQRRFSGVIEKETLPETISAMQISFPFSYVLDGDRLTLSSKKIR